MQKRWQQEYEWLTGTGDPLNQPIIYGHRLPTAAEMRQGPFFGAPVMMAPGETYAQAVKNWATYVCRSSNPGPGFCEWSETVSNSPANGWDAVFTVLGAVGLAAGAVGGSGLRAAVASSRAGSGNAAKAVGRSGATVKPEASTAVEGITVLGLQEKVAVFTGKPGYSTLQLPGERVWKVVLAQE